MTSLKLAFIGVLIALVGAIVAADDDDHSKHCHIAGFPTIHTNIGDSINLPGACLKLICKSSDLYEVVNTCKTDLDSTETDNYADKLVKGLMCPN